MACIPIKTILSRIHLDLFLFRCVHYQALYKYGINPIQSEALNCVIESEQHSKLLKAFNPRRDARNTPDF